MVYAVIFDLDGTLADTMDDLGTAMNNMLKKLGYDTRTKGELIRFINNGARNFVRLSLPEELQNIDFVIDSALSTYEDEYSKCCTNDTYPFDGVTEALWGLRERKIRLGVLSNKQDSFVKAIVEKLFGKKLFKSTLGNKEGLPKKPDPQGALLVAKALGAKPSNCIFVGDSDVDVKTAHNAGMLSIAVTWGYRTEQVLRTAGADYIANDTEALIGIIDKILDEKDPKRKKTKAIIKRNTDLSKYENKQAPDKQAQELEESKTNEPLIQEEKPQEKIEDQKSQDKKSQEKVEEQKIQEQKPQKKMATPVVSVTKRNKKGS